MKTGQGSTEQCTFAVVGDGIAASIAAAALARADCPVVQFLGRARGGAPEILGPQTMQRLQQFGIIVDDRLGSVSKGTLSLWGNEAVEHTDQALLSVQPPLSVNPGTLRAELVRICKALGVRQVNAPAIARGANTIYWKSGNNQTRSLYCDHVLVGAGRSTSFGPFGKDARVRRDKLVAFTLDWNRVERRSDLAVEAQADGWWYAPPACGDIDQIAFLSDFDLLPQGLPARLQYLDERFRQTRLLVGLGSLDLQSKLTGVDAHTGFCMKPVTAPYVAIGDTALSVDPLAGLGVLHAVESGWFAGNELLAGRDLADDYSEWIEALAAEQFAIAQSEYDKAIDRFQDSKFWSRRRATRQPRRR